MHSLRRGALLLLLAAGCAGARPQFDRAQAQTLRTGMTREQVKAVLGPPMYVVLDLPNPRHTTEAWRYVDNDRALELHFDDARLVLIHGP